MTAALKIADQGFYLDNQDMMLIEAIQGGLPLVERPYAEIGERLGWDEQTVIDGIADLIERGVIKRFGVVVRHRQLGYTANGMVVWDIKDKHVDATARKIAAFDFVTLCYRRPRRRPHWPYNLFCMIHGQSHEQVKLRLQNIVDDLTLQDTPHDILFSTRCFKQRGARYFGLGSQSS